MNLTLKLYIFEAYELVVKNKTQQKVTYRLDWKDWLVVFWKAIDRV